MISDSIVIVISPRKTAYYGATFPGRRNFYLRTGMGFANIQRVIGFLVAASSLMMLPPVLVSLFYGDGSHMLFLISAAIYLAVGLLIFMPVRNETLELRLRDGFLVVTCSLLG